MLRSTHRGFDIHSSDLPRILMPLLAGLLLLSLLVASISQPRAAEVIGPHDFIIPASDGYGTSECLTKQSACGRAIADAWCESHGHAHAVAYGPAEDITGLIKPNTSPIDIPLDAVIVSCGN